MRSSSQPTTCGAALGRAASLSWSARPGLPRRSPLRLVAVAGSRGGAGRRNFGSGGVSLHHVLGLDG